MVALTSQHMRIARLAARAMYAQLPKKVGVNLCDLESAANFGLFQASVQYRDGICSFEGYARVCIRGAILDALRSLDTVTRATRKQIQAREESKSQRQPLRSREMALLPSKEPSPEQLAIQQQEVDRIRLLIPKLSRRDQSLLRMRHVDNLSMQEIATCLRVTEGRVSQMHKRTREKLRRLLAPSSQRLPISKW